MTRADLLVGVEQLFALRVEGGQAGGELAAVLQVEQQPRHQAGDLLRPRQRGQLGGLAREVVDRGNAALVVQFVHAASPR